MVLLLHQSSKAAAAAAAWLAWFHHWGGRGAWLGEAVAVAVAQGLDTCQPTMRVHTHRILLVTESF